MGVFEILIVVSQQILGFFGVCPYSIIVSSVGGTSSFIVSSIRVISVRGNSQFFYVWSNFEILIAIYQWGFGDC